jgi:hypothetical protein
VFLAGTECRRIGAMVVGIAALEEMEDSLQHAEDKHLKETGDFNYI